MLFCVVKRFIRLFNDFGRIALIGNLRHTNADSELIYFGIAIIIDGKPDSLEGDGGIFVAISQQNNDKFFTAIAKGKVMAANAFIEQSSYQDQDFIAI